MTRILFFTDERSIYFTEKPQPPEELAAEINAGTYPLDLSGINLPQDRGRLVALCYGDLVILTWEVVPRSARSQINKDSFSLTDRERQVLQELSEGKTPKLIARLHNVKIRTIREQIQILKRKLRAKTTEQLVARGIVLRLVQPSRGQDDGENHTE